MSLSQMFMVGQFSPNFNAAPNQAQIALGPGGVFYDIAANPRVYYVITADLSGFTPFGSGGTGGNPAWGSITGTLGSQTDLSTALAAANQNAAWGHISGTLASQTDLAAAITAALAGATWGSINGSIAAQTDLQNALAAAAAGGAPVAWQSVTPNPNGTSDILIDRNNGVNVKLKPIAGATQLVTLPTNCADGQTMEIDLYGGSFSGSWVTWNPASPTTPGYYFASGAAPVAPAAAGMVQQIFITRDGPLYRAVFGGVQVAN